MEKMRMESVDMTAQNVDKIGALFPNCVTETMGEDGKLRKAINFDMLRQMLSGDVVEGDEAYEFTWVGKKAAIVEANKPIRKTLRPCPEESKDWDTTENLYIEGDNLEVLKLLQESYLGRIKMIYIDPPYNTGNDFIYRDDFATGVEEYQDQMGMFDEEDNRLFRNTDSNGRFHSDWCSMIYSRLLLARNLLSHDGAIFISINDYESDNLRKICDDVFGRENFVSQVVWQKSKKGDAKLVSVCHEYVLIYVKGQRELLANGVKWRQPKQGLEDIFAHYDSLRAKYGKNHEEIQRQMRAWYNSLPTDHPARASKHYNCSDDRGLYFAADFAGPDDGRTSRPRYDIIHPVTGFPCKKPSTGWRWDEARTKAAMAENPPLIHFGPTHETIPCRKSYLKEVSTEPFNSVFYKDGRSATLRVEQLLGKGIFDFPKDEEVLARLIDLAADKDAIILDFFSGSASTAGAVMQLNNTDGGHRKYIMVQLPEPCEEKSGAYKAGYRTICEIGKERIRRAGAKIKDDSPLTTQELDVGFRVLKLASTNMTDVYYGADEYSQDLLSSMESNIKADRTELDLLFGCLLDWGLSLSEKFAMFQIDGINVYAYGMTTEEYHDYADHMVTYQDGIQVIDCQPEKLNAPLIACFAENVPEAVIKRIAKMQPLRVVFRDSCFADSPSKINVYEIFKMLAPDTRVKVI